LALADRVRLLGERTDVAELLAEAQAFVLISDWEAFPLSILEAMRAGLPVVASDVGGVQEAVLDGRTGLLVPRGDMGGLRERLRRLLCDPGLRSRLGAAGRRRYQAHFTFEHMLHKTLDVYNAVLAQARQRAPGKV
jgi:glycosyltransferase involved in cell wall biosynthesis